MRIPLLLRLSVPAFIVCVAAANANATFITPGAAFGPGLGAELKNQLGPAFGPIDDNQVFLSGETWEIDLRITSVAPVYIPVVVDTTESGTVEYDVFMEIENRTPHAWTGLRIDLGFGGGASPFLISPSSDGLDTDFPDQDNLTEANGSFDVSPLAWTEDTIVFGGGSPMNPHPDLASFDQPFLFAIDVPDSISAFTIRITPIAPTTFAEVPEPACAAMLVTMAPLIAMRRRRARR